MKTNNSNILSVKSRWAIRPLVSEDVYTDREEHLEYLYNAAIDAATRRTMSTVLEKNFPGHYFIQRKISNFPGNFSIFGIVCGSDPVLKKRYISMLLPVPRSG